MIKKKNIKKPKSIEKKINLKPERDHKKTFK